MDSPREVLIFDLDAMCCGVDAGRVREIMWLPELSAVAAAPPGVVGVLNRRGEILPVVDAGEHLQGKRHRRRISDQVAVLAGEGETLFGLVVSEVRDLVRLPPGVTLLPSHMGPPESGAPVAGTLQVGDQLVNLLDVARLAPGGGKLAEAMDRETGIAPEEVVEEADASVLRSRARALRQPVSPEGESRVALAVVALGGQYFGIELGAVREFCRVSGLLPIPCCPPHVAGAFSLRGHFVILLELAAALGLPPPAEPRAKAVIGSLGEAAVGMAADDVLDVVTTAADELQAPPAEFARLHRDEVRAIASYGERPLVVLDLPALLARADWVVDETVG